MPEVAQDLLTDDDLCDLLRISRNTMLRYLRQGPPRVRRGDSAGDIRTIRHITVGSQRRWVRKSVEEFIHGEA